VCTCENFREVIRSESGGWLASMTIKHREEILIMSTPTFVLAHIILWGSAHT